MVAANKLDVEEWRSKLVGKYIVKKGEATTLDEDKYFRQEDLPKYHRLLMPNTPATRDFRFDRLNVEMNDNMKVYNVRYG